MPIQATKAGTACFLVFGFWILDSGFWIWIPDSVLYDTPT